MRDVNTGPGPVVRTNRFREMAVYDELPPELRKVFQDGCRNYSVLQYAEALVAGARLDAVVAFARRSDREMRGDGIVRPEHSSC